MLLTVEYNKRCYCRNNSYIVRIHIQISTQKIWMIFWKLKVIDQSQTFKKTFISLITGVEEVKILRVVCIFYDAIKWSPLRICDRNSVRYCLKERKSWVQLHNKKCKFHNKYKLCEEISVKMMQCLIILFIVGISQLNGE